MIQISRLGLSVKQTLILSMLSSYEYLQYLIVTTAKRVLWPRLRKALTYKYRYKYLEGCLTIYNSENKNKQNETKENLQTSKTVIDFSLGPWAFNQIKSIWFEFFPMRQNSNLIQSSWLPHNIGASVVHFCCYCCLFEFLSVLLYSLS